MRYIIVLLTMICSKMIQAQGFSKADSLEINILNEWKNARIIEQNDQAKIYLVQTISGKIYTIPVLQAERWLRLRVIPEKIEQKPSAKKVDSIINCTPMDYKIKEKVREDVWRSNPLFENILISYVAFKEEPTYVNTNDSLGKAGAIVFPYSAEYYVDLATGQRKDGGAEKKRWLCKANYVLYQDSNGTCLVKLEKEIKEIVSE